MARVTGIGGVFFKAKDPEALKAWYVKYLGIEIAEWGSDRPQATVDPLGLRDQH